MPIQVELPAVMPRVLYQTGPICLGALLLLGRDEMESWAVGSYLVLVLDKVEDITRDTHSMQRRKQMHLSMLGIHFVLI